MDRRKFIIRFGEALPFAALGFYLLSDKRNLTRNDVSPSDGAETVLAPDEREILYLASLAPSGHNSQPWFVRYVEPYHWIIGNESSRWLPAVDPGQRETMLSIGAFAMNLEIAANHFGYEARIGTLATKNQDENVLEVRLVKSESAPILDIEPLRNRRTIRGRFATRPVADADLAYLFGSSAESFAHLPAAGIEGRRIGELTLEANREQMNRDDAQRELTQWVRFSSREAARYRDGLTTASMEITGFSGWFVRNLYIRENALSADFRERGLAKVSEQIGSCGSWILLFSKDDSTASLIEAGRRMEQLFLRVRDHGIALHPMTQILEEASTREALRGILGSGRDPAMILRTGYVDDYPPPVSMRRPADWFVRY